MRHTWSISDSPDLPIRAFHKALGKNRPATLEGGKGGGPSAPDPYQTAAAQTQSNQATAAYNKALNLGNYSNPFGSQTSSISGYDPVSGAPIYQTNVTANSALQNLLNNQLNQVNQSSGAINNAVSGLGNLQGQYQGLGNQYANLNNSLAGMSASNAMGTGQDAYYKAATAYLDPQYAQQQTSLESKLAAQGLAPGSQAYQNAMGNFQRDKDFAYNQAANSAITQGQQLGLNQLQAQQGLIGQQQQGLAAQGGLLGNQSGLIGQQLGANQAAYGNLGSIAGLIPGYTGTGNAGAGSTDIGSYINNAYQGELGKYNAQQQSNNATMSTLGSVAGMAAMAFF